MATPSGIPQLGDLAPGSHVGQLYRDQQDLLDTLVPFFAAGLAANERCIWVTAHPLGASQARAALARVVPDLAQHERSKQIEILDHSAWHTRSGEMTSEQVIESWLSAEEAALRDGYAGLRLSGNTYWLGSEQWASFADYECKVHAAFQGRKIIALCSYSLAKCDEAEVVDVLRNHSISLVRSNDTWEVVHGATAALAALEPNRLHAHQTRPHTVEFYRDTFPAARVAERLCGAMRARHAAAALVTAPHMVELRAALTARDVDIAAAMGRGQLLLVDADEVFARAWTRPGLRTNMVEQLVLRPLRDAIALYGHVVAFGELVDIFARHDDRDGAIALEHWWNDQLIRYSIDLACGYTLDAFAAGDQVDTFNHVCNAHSAFGIDAPPADAEVDRLRVELGQLTTALASEMARRQAAEAAYESTRIGRGQLVRLDRLASALGEVTTRLELVDVMTEIVGTTLDTDGVLLVEHHDNGTESTLVGHGVGVDTMRHVQAASGSRSVWSNDPSALGAESSPLRALFALPLYAGGRRLGMCVMGFATPRELNPPFRALAQDVVRQIALALDRATTYERLDHERERAELASRAKDEFLAMLGHELRNPLAPILTATQLMRLRGSDANEKERVVIERQCKHMMRLVDDLLDVSRITRGKVELRRRAVEVADIVAQAVELASPALEERNHKLSIDVDPNGVVVHADPQRLAQVICNLLTNAARYTPPGGDVHLSVHPGASTVSVSVRDNGIGIDAKLLPHIFDSFVQGRQGIDRAAGGLGLGLAIAKSLLDMHGGSIRATSEGPNKGSEFTIELPRFANTRPSARNTSGAFALPSSRRRRVLVVDDNEDAAFLFSEALKRLGHHVDVAYDGPTALEAARENPPEIAFLDIGLPVMDGYELGRRLRELGGKPPHLIAVTGYGHTSDKERSRDAGFEMHLVKPIELSQVTDAMTKLD